MERRKMNEPLKGETMIEVSHLNKRYGHLHAVNDVSFQVRKGEIVGFLGPNGAGKSTVLKIMTCFLPPTSGTVRIGGLDVGDHPLEVRKKFGYLPESAPLYLDMTAVDYLKYVGSLRGLSGKKLQQRIQQVAGAVGITKVLGQVTGTLSKGYRQRVCLAQALIHDPEFLILDEPTVGLDPNQVVEIRSLIKELGKDRTVILSTHILPEVLATCDRIIIIHKGRIVADGTARELERKVASSATVIVRFKKTDTAGSQAGLKARLEAVLSAAAAEGAVTERSTPDADEWEFKVSVSGERDLRPAILQAFARESWPLLEVRRDVLDIEGLFRTLTQE
jgi:ABC-2 type transport system ATP-binding protein